MTPDEARAFAVRAVRAKLQEFIGTVQASRQRAVNAGDCNVMELMVVAGRTNEAAVARILPRLVRLADDRGQRQYWEPDFVAQGYVKGLHTTGAALRALDEYAAIDDAYKAMAVALVTGGLAYGLSAAGYAASAGYLMLTADAADMLYFGGKDVHAYFEGHALADYARGLTPAAGDEFLAEAELAASEWYWTALGVIAPGIGVGSGIKELRQLRKAEAIGRGARLLSGVDNLDAATLSRMSDAQRADLAAAFTDLQARKLAQGADALDAAEQAQLAKFEKYFAAARSDPGAARPAAAAAPAPSGAPVPSATARAPAELPPVETLAAGRPAASAPSPPSPAPPSATIDPPRGMPPIPRQENPNTCGIATARGAIQRLTGRTVSEQDLARRSIVSGRGYKTGIDFETGELVHGGAWPREMVEMLDEAGVSTRVPYGRRLPEAGLEAGGEVNVPRRLGESGGRTVAPDPRLENPRFTLDDASREIREENQVLTVLDYSRTRGPKAAPHWVVVEEVGNGPLVRNGRTVIDGPYVIVGDPARGGSVPMSQAEFDKTWVPESTVIALNPKTQPSVPLPRRADTPSSAADAPGPSRPAGTAGERPGARLPDAERVSVSFMVPDKIYRLLDDPKYGPQVESYIQAFDSYTAKVARGQARRSDSELEDLYYRLQHDRLLPPEVKASLVRQFGRNHDPQAGILRLFDGRPPSAYVLPDPDLGFATTTTRMRQDVYKAPYIDPFTYDPDRTSPTVRKPAQLEADHILPVDAIKKLNWKLFRQLSPERQQRIIYHPRNIHPLDPELNKLKSNLSARKFQEVMEQKGRPLSSHYVQWLEERQHEMAEYFDKLIGDLYREQVSRGG